MESYAVLVVLAVLPTIISARKYVPEIHRRPGRFCGLRPSDPRAMDELIVAGEEAKAHSWPWQVRIFNKDLDEGCGGTILSDRWILTAAHCISARDPKFYVLNVGIHNKSNINETARKIVSIKTIIVHEKYDAATMSADIALLYTGDEIKFSKLVSPACLPAKEVPVGSKCVVTGFGYTSNDANRKTLETLQEVYLPIISETLCASYWQGFDVKIDNTTLCVAAPNGGTDSCAGASGGPLVCKAGANWEVQGIVSLGRSGCGTKQSAGIYTKVIHYIPWILKNIIKNMTSKSTIFYLKKTTPLQDLH